MNKSEGEKDPGFIYFPKNIRERLDGIRLPSRQESDPEDTRSRRAVMAEKVLRAVNDGHLSSVEASEEFLRRRAAEEDDFEPFLPLIKRGHGSVSEFQGIPLITYGDSENEAGTVLYLHGGAYTEEILPFHLNFCARLAERDHVCVLVPLYPLAPNHIWRETYDILTALYRQMLTQKRGKITFMGDSAGGGLVFAFAQYLKTLALPQPDHLIALSPWVDVCMIDQDYEPYRELDPMLDVAGLRTIGKAWAGDLDVRDPKISPTFGDNHGLPKTLIFCGTREILYPDICAYYEKLRRDGVDAELIVAEGMNHVYPLYGLPESQQALICLDAELKD